MINILDENTTNINNNSRLTVFVQLTILLILLHNYLLFCIVLERSLNSGGSRKKKPERKSLENLRGV